LPRISDDYTDTVVYLYPSEVDAQKGKKAGGSGFLFGIPSEKFPNSHFIYAVTNRHVIEGGSCCVRLNTADGKMAVLSFTERDWCLHPSGDDLAVCQMPIEDGGLYQYKFLHDDHLLTKQIVEDYNIGTGDDIFVVGRFINQEGKQKNVPSLRFGNISQMPAETIRQQRGSAFFEQESFLVEARSIGGYSGSPVFVGLLPNIQRPAARKQTMTGRAWLLGIDWGYILDWEPVCDAGGRPVDSGLRVSSNTGMMAVVPAWKLRELLDSDVLKNLRKLGGELTLKKQK
jgi:hypothetical protein